MKLALGHRLQQKAGSVDEPEQSAAPTVENAAGSFRGSELFEEESWKMVFPRIDSVLEDFREIGPWTPTPAKASSVDGQEQSAAPTVDNADWFI